MQNISTLWGREPAVVLGVIQAAISLLLVFGLELSPAQVGAIMAFANVTIALITRSQVTPTSKLPQ